MQAENIPLCHTPIDEPHCSGYKEGLPFLSMDFISSTKCISQLNTRRRRTKRQPAGTSHKRSRFSTLHLALALKIRNFQMLWICLELPGQDSAVSRFLVRLVRGCRICSMRSVCDESEARLGRSNCPNRPSEAIQNVHSSSIFKNCTIRFWTVRRIVLRPIPLPKLPGHRLSIDPPLHIVDLAIMLKGLLEEVEALGDSNP